MKRICKPFRRAVQVVCDYSYHRSRRHNVRNALTLALKGVVL